MSTIEERKALERLSLAMGRVRSGVTPPPPPEETPPALPPPAAAPQPAQARSEPREEA